MRIVYGLFLFFFNIIFSIFHVFKKFLFAVAILLLSIFGYMILCTFLYPNATLSFNHYTILENILNVIIFAIIPLIIIFLRKPTEKLADSFIDFLSQHFMSCLSYEELYYTNKTNQKQNYSSNAKQQEEKNNNDTSYSDADDSSEENNNNNNNSSTNFSQFVSIDLFRGVRTLDELKKRHRDLLKIYHPDNSSGDENMTKYIQSEYERLLEQLK